MKELDLNTSEKELKKRWELPYIWGRKQNDEWDKYSGFIYEIWEWELLKAKIKEVSREKKLDEKEFLNYCSNRWYNFLSARAVEKIFSNLQGVVPAENSKNKLVDFYLQGISFDLKTSVFPANYTPGLSYAQTNPEKLILWLYENQSGQQRKHLENRLFLIVHSRDGHHWKLKAELNWLKDLITNYIKGFKAKNLIELELQPGKTTFSDIIWAIK